MNKKNILICIHNPFALVNLIPTLEEISNSYHITIMTSNYLLENKQILKKTLEIKKNLNIKNLLILPFYYSNSDQRNIFSIIKSHLYLLKIKNILKQESFKLCISDGSFFLWQKIILNEFVNKNCLKIGITHDSLNLHLDKLDEFLAGKDINKILDEVHKLRQIKKLNNGIKSKKFFSKIKNSIISFNDKYIDRILIPLIFYKKKFLYMKNDFKTAFDTNSFKYVINFFYSSYLFWGKYYGENNVFLVSPKTNCKCNNLNKKNKILFISSILWSKNNESLDFQTDYFFKFLEKKVANYESSYEIDFRHHPMQLEEDAKYINEHLIKKNKKNFRINFKNNFDSISSISCNYKIIFGCISSALYFAKHGCNNVELYCLKSISKNELGEKYYLKLYNEDIKMFDDINNSFESFQDLPSKNYKSLKQILDKIENLHKQEKSNE